MVHLVVDNQRPTLNVHHDFGPQISIIAYICMEVAWVLTRKWALSWDTMVHIQIKVRDLVGPGPIISSWLSTPLTLNIMWH